MHDALEQLRNALGLKSFLVRQKVTLSGGQGLLLRFETEIDCAGRHVQKWREVYPRAWKALNRLWEDGPEYGMESKLRVLRELENEDCIMVSEWMEENRIWRKEGECAEAEAAARAQKGGRREVPWFWKIQFDIKGDDVNDIKGAVRNWTTNGKNSQQFCWQNTNILHSYPD